MTKQERIDAAARAALTGLLLRREGWGYPEDLAHEAYHYAKALEAERDERLKAKGCSTCIHNGEPYRKCQYCDGGYNMWEAKDD